MQAGRVCRQGADIHAAFAPPPCHLCAAVTSAHCCVPNVCSGTRVSLCHCVSLGLGMAPLMGVAA